MSRRGKQFFFRCQASLGRGPVGFSDGGNRRDWFPGVRGPRAASSAEGNHTHGNAYRILLRLEIHFGIIRSTENKF